LLGVSVLIHTHAHYILNKLSFFPNHHMSELIGKPAPVLSLPTSNGDIFTLTPGKGKSIVLFFYPKSGSWGCTREVCQFRDAVAEKPTFNADHTQVVGISPDSVANQKAFVERHQVNYPILSDEQGEARNIYGIGKALWGIAAVARTTFIIDSNGIIRDVLDTTLNYNAHSKWVSKWLDQLEAEAKATHPETIEPRDPASIPATTELTESPAEAPASTAAPATTKSPTRQSPEQAASSIRLVS